MVRTLLPWSTKVRKSKVMVSEGEDEKRKLRQRLEGCTLMMTIDDEVIDQEDGMNRRSKPPLPKLTGFVFIYLNQQVSRRRW